MKAIRYVRLMIRRLHRPGRPAAVEASAGSNRPLRGLADLVHRIPFVLVTAVATLGVLVDCIWYQSFESSLIRWGLLAGLAVMLPLFQRAFAGRRGENAAATVWLSSGLLLVSCFGLWHAWDEHRYRSATVMQLTGGDETPVVVRGVLSKMVTLRPNPIARRTRYESPWQSQLTMALESIRRDGIFRPIDGNVLVFVDGDLSARRPGDRLEVYGWVRSLTAPTNPGEPDLRPSYRRRRLHAFVETKNAGAITLLSRSHVLGSLIASIATRGREALLRHTDRQTGPLAIALVVGQREFVDPNTRDALLATGTAHLLSVSGMHLAIIVLVVGWVVSGFGMRPISRFVVILAISLLYVLVTGGRPPVFRAAILIALWLLSTCFRRTSQPLNTLAVAAFILILLNPMNVFAVGVHLSFLAVMTLMIAGRPVAAPSVRAELELQRESSFQTLLNGSYGPQMVLARSTGRFFAQMAWLSACVTAVTFPLVWSQFHLLSLVSVVTNVLVWAGLMLALPAGVLTVLIDPLSQGLAGLPGALCHGSLAYMWQMIRWTESWPCGHAWLPAPPTPMVVVFYLVLLVSLLRRSSAACWFRRGWIVIWGLLALSMATRSSPLPEGTLEATFIDVGHGTSVILRTPDRKVWLYDCGRMGNELGTSRDIDTALWYLGVTHLDAVFLSHADADHYNALPAILKRFTVDRVFTPPGMLETDETGLSSIRKAIVRSQIPVREMANAVTVDGGESTSVLHPPWAGVGAGDNANSLVLRIDQAGKTLILPGDLEPPGTEVLVRLPRPPPGGVLMAPHHGSLTMNAEMVLSWARPAETVVSGGDRAARPEVEQMLSLTGSGVHVTAVDGAIRVRIDRSGKIEVRSWLSRPW